MRMILHVRDLFLRLADWLSPWLIPSMARIVFAGVLLVYYWNSAATKVGDGLFGIIFPSVGAYAQIFPKAMERVGYDPSQLTIVHWFIAFAGTIAEFVLPLLILVGLLTRLASIGMIGFVVVQSYVDAFGHGLTSKDIGTWFDSSSGSLIFDQRAFWIFLFLILILKGPGPISVDRYLSRVMPGGSKPPD